MAAPLAVVTLPLCILSPMQRSGTVHTRTPSNAIAIVPFAPLHFPSHYPVSARILDTICKFLIWCLHIVETVPHCCWPVFAGLSYKSRKFKPFHILNNLQYLILKVLKLKTHPMTVDMNRPSTVHTQGFNALLTVGPVARAVFRLPTACSVTVVVDTLVGLNSGHSGPNR